MILIYNNKKYGLFSLLSGTALFVLTAFSITLHAGDIPGLPVVQPPGLQGDLQLQVGNDFFSILNNTDDFRTQQFSISGFVTDRWLLVVDQSILTVRGPNRTKPDPAGTEGRLDQYSISMAYQSYFKQSQLNIDQILIGTGLRSVGEFNGAKIQHGAHRLFKDESITLPYVTTERTDAVVWLRASRQHYFTNNSNDSNWQPGYWLDGSALLSSDGQSDGMLGIYGLLHYKYWDFWTGLRGDWRTGYDRDIVQKLTAEQERGFAIAVGISIGPLRLETIEGIAGNENSFGRMVLTASSDKAVKPDSKGALFAYQFAMLNPEIALQTQFRWSASSWRFTNSARYSVVFDHRYGTPTLDNSPTQFNISSQIIVGVEAAVIGKSTNDWFQPYLMLGVGNRSEYIEGDDILTGQQSEKVNSEVFVADLGVRFFLAGSANSWMIQLQLGLTGWYPFQKKQVIFNGESITVLKADTSGMAGVNFMFYY